MPTYDIYPAVDEDYNFPPQIRQKIVEYPEIRDTILRVGNAESKATDLERSLTDATMVLDSVSTGLQNLEMATIPQIIEQMLQGDTQAAEELQNLSFHLEEAETKLVLAENTIAELRDVTLPQMRSDLDAADKEVGEQLLTLDQKIVDADQKLASASTELDTLKNTTLPAMREELKEADASALETLSNLQTNLQATEAAVAESKQSISTLEDVTLPQMLEALEQADAQAQKDLRELEDRLAEGAGGDSAALAQLREDLEAAQEAVAAAQSTADAATTAASAANKAALEAAGIADAKGRVIYSEKAPGKADQSASNLWIKPSTEETFVWDGSKWELVTSDTLEQAAQNALDAQKAAATAQSSADAAKAQAASALAAAQKAQQTADKATLDARDAHNAAVAAQDSAAALRADMLSGPTVWDDSSFERGKGPVPTLADGRIERTQEWAATGSWSIKYTATGSGGNNYGVYEWVPVTAGRWYALSATVHAATGKSGVEANIQPFTVKDGDVAGPAQRLIVDAGGAQTKTDTIFFQVPSGATIARYWVGQRASWNQANHKGQELYLDDFRLVDVTDTYPAVIAAEKAAQAAQERADAAYGLAESRPDQKAVQEAAKAAQDAATKAAAADAKAKADRAKADALAGAAKDAESKAEAARAAAVAAASEDAAKKAQKALQDALAALKEARGEITAEIKASVNGKNSITISTAAPGKTPGVAKGDTWWRVDGSNMIFGQWTWSGSAWVPAMIRNEVLAGLDVHKLQVTGSAKMAEAVIDKLWVDGLAAKAITTSRLTVAASPSENMIPNGDLLEDATFWDGDSRVTRTQITGVSGVSYALTIAPGTSTTNTLYTGPEIAVKPGQTYLVEFWMRADKPGSVIFIEMRPPRASWSEAYETTRMVAPRTENELKRILSNEQVPMAWTHYQIEVTTAPTTSRVEFASFYWNHNSGTERGAQVWIAGLSMRPKVGSVLIEDGAVSAQHVQAESVAGAVGKFVKAEVGNLVAGTGSFDSLAADKMWADQFASKAITTSRLTVSPGNIYRDPGLIEKVGFGNYWQSGLGYSGGNSVVIPASDSQVGSYDLLAPGDRKRTKVEGGTTYRIGAWVRTSANANARTVALYTRWYTTTGSLTGAISGPTAPDLKANTWTWVEGDMKAPVDAVEMCLGFYLNSGYTGSARFSDPSVRAKVGTVLIEDGAVNADKVNAESVAGAVGKFIKLDVGQLTAASGTFNEAVAKKMWADQFAAMSISAARIAVAPGNLLTWIPRRTTAPYDISPNRQYGNAASDIRWGTDPDIGEMLDITLSDDSPKNLRFIMNFGHPSDETGVRAYSVNAIPVTGEAYYRFELTICRGGNYPNGAPVVSVAAYWYGPDGKLVNTSTATPVGPSGSQEAPFSNPPRNGCDLVAPKGAVGLILFLRAIGTGHLYIGTPSLREKNKSVLIEDGAISAQQINAESVGGAIGKFVTITTDQITSGTATVKEAVIDKLWADGIAAKTITTSRLAVAHPNVYPDPYLKENRGWGQYYHYDGGKDAGSGRIRIPNTSGEVVVKENPPTDERTPVLPSSSYAFSFWVYLTSEQIWNESDLKVRVYRYNKSGSMTSPVAATYVDFKTVPMGRWVNLTATFTTGADDHWITLEFSSTPTYGRIIDISNFSIMVQTPSVLIEDGAVTADKIFASSALITKIFTSELMAGKITTEMFSTQAAFEGEGVVINRKGVTVHGPSGRAGIFIDSAGLRGVKSDGSNTFRIDKSGDAYFSGSITSEATITGSTFKTSSTGRRIQISGDILQVYDSSNIRQMEMDDKGLTFWYGSRKIGSMGETNKDGNTNVRGIMNLINHTGDFVTWAYMESSTAKNSTPLFTMDPRGKFFNNGAPGLHIGGNGLVGSDSNWNPSWQGFKIDAINVDGGYKPAIKWGNTYLVFSSSALYAVVLGKWYKLAP